MFIALLLYRDIDAGFLFMSHDPTSPGRVLPGYFGREKMVPWPRHCRAAFAVMPAWERTIIREGPCKPKWMKRIPAGSDILKDENVSLYFVAWVV
jgi:hypothetical protein